MHRLHNATVESAVHDFDLESDGCLAMLLEGLLAGKFGSDAAGPTAPVLFNAGASSNVESPRLLIAAICGLCFFFCVLLLGR